MPRPSVGLAPARGLSERLLLVPAPGLRLALAWLHHPWPLIEVDVFERTARRLPRTSTPRDANGRSAIMTTASKAAAPSHERNDLTPSLNFHRCGLDGNAITRTRSSIDAFGVPHSSAHLSVCSSPRSSNRSRMARTIDPRWHACCCARHRRVNWMVVRPFAMRIMWKAPRMPSAQCNIAAGSRSNERGPSSMHADSLGGGMRTIPSAGASICRNTQSWKLGHANTQAQPQPAQQWSTNSAKNLKFPAPTQPPVNGQWWSK